jgi:serine/threonine protein kinase/Tol biopolymer transport system component
LIGTSLGPYKIIELLGAGGMGEVYLAEDTRLAREVAVKVLPEALAADAERLARLEREARVLAQLNHANVAVIHGLEEHGGRLLLIMEYAEGETLADRIQTGGAMPLAEVVDIAGKVADGLEAAHDKGIVHRDLKPANIMVSDDASGSARVKLLDFGLAKAYEPDGTLAEISPELSKSPTMAVVTMTGLIMGTASYMSPEQARGKRLDRRADVWAFACVVYEMLSGGKAFDGDTVSDVFAAILKEEPDWSRLPATTPPALRALLERCFRKDPARRLRDIGDVRVEMEDASSEASPPQSTESAPLPLPSSAAARLVPWAVAAIAMTMAAWAVLGELTGPDISSAPMQRFNVIVPEDQLLPERNLTLAVSPSGTEIVYSAERDGVSMLYRRRIDSFTAEPIDGTEGADRPTFAPDGESVAFRQGNAVRAVSMDGGALRSLCAPCSATHGFAWGPDGTVIAAPAWATPLEIIAGPRDPGAITELDVTRGDISHLWPHFLPGGGSVLFTIWAGRTTYGAVVSLDDGAIRIVGEGGSNYRYVEPGYLVSGREGALVAEAFDLASLQSTGPQIVVADDVKMSVDAFAYYGASSSGMLAFQQGSSLTRIVWVDRNDGGMTEAWPRSSGFGSVRVSRDNRYVVSDVATSSNTYEVWLLDLAAGTPQLLSSGSDDVNPVFSPDDSKVAYSSATDDGYAILSVSVEGSREPEELLRRNAYIIPTDWSADGRYVAYHVESPGGDVWLLPTDGGEPRRATDSVANETGGTISPDSKWIAFASDRSGRNEIWVDSMDNPGRPQQITFEGGEMPLWSPLGSEIFYRRGAEIRAQPISTEPSFRLTGDFTSVLDDRRLPEEGRYHVSSDGKRLLLARLEDAGLEDHYFNVIPDLPAFLERERGR